MNLSQRQSFFGNLATTCKPKRVSPFRSTGARLLSRHADEIRLAVASGYTTDAIVKSLQKLPNSPLAGLAPSTRKQYVSQLRAETRMIRRVWPACKVKLHNNIQTLRGECVRLQKALQSLIH